MEFKIESKLDVMKVQYAIIRAEWEAQARDRNSDENYLDNLEEMLLAAETGLRNEFLDVSADYVGRDGEQFELLRRITHTDKFFDTITKGGRV